MQASESHEHSYLKFNMLTAYNKLSNTIFLIFKSDISNYCESESHIDWSSSICTNGIKYTKSPLGHPPIAYRIHHDENILFVKTGYYFDNVDKGIYHDICLLKNRNINCIFANALYFADLFVESDFINQIDEFISLRKDIFKNSIDKINSRIMAIDNFVNDFTKTNKLINNIV